MIYQPTWEELLKYEKDGLVTIKENPEAGLFVINYTNKVQYDYLWTEKLLNLRGLIVDKHCNVVERPFKKFFNLEEPMGKPPENEEYEVFEKMDGALGILYFNKNTPYISTRGSFFSDQAKKATEIYHEKYKQVNIERDLTYLFEIISKESHIVVDYDYEDLVLIDIIDKSTGKTARDHIRNYPFKTPKCWGKIPIDEIYLQEKKNREGVVLKTVDTDFRTKIKFDPYKHLHKLISGLGSKKSVLEVLVEYKTFDNFLLNNTRGSQVADEAFNYIRETEEEIQSRKDAIIEESYSFFNDNPTKGLTEMQIADLFSKFKYPWMLFGILRQNKDLDQMAYKIIKKEIKNEN